MNWFKNRKEKENGTDPVTTVVKRKFTLTITTKIKPNITIYITCNKDADVDISDAHRDVIDWYTLKPNKMTYELGGDQFIRILHRDNIVGILLDETTVVV